MNDAPGAATPTMVGFGPAVWNASLAACPPEVLALMGPMQTLPLEGGDLAWLAGQTGAPTPGLEPALAEALVAFSGTGAHLRLGLCSFKRGTGRLLPVFTAAQAMTTLRAPGPRVAGIARQVLAEDRDDALYLRPWREIPRWCEFRVFIHGGQVVGISQYHLDRSYPEIHSRGQEISGALGGLLQRLLPVLHVPDIVADVALDPSFATPALLLEVNPYLRRTDACLFRWGQGPLKGDFDGGFRVL